MVERDIKQRLSQFTQLMRDKYEASDTSLTGIKNMIEDLVVYDPTKKTPKKKFKFLLQKRDRLEEFQELVSKEYDEVIELITTTGEIFDRCVKKENMMNDLTSIISQFNMFNHCLHTFITSYLNFSHSRELEMFGGLMEQLEIFLENYQKKKNEVLDAELPEDADMPHPIRSESHVSHLNGENWPEHEHNGNTRGCEVLPGSSGYVLPSRSIEPDGIRVRCKRKNYERVDTEQNTPPKIHKTITKESIPDGRNIGDNVAPAVAESATRDDGKYEDDNKFDESEVVTISDDDREDTNEITNAGNSGSLDRANCSTRVNEEDEASSTSGGSDCVLNISVPDFARISDHSDDPKHCKESRGNETERNNDGINDDFQNPSGQVEPFDDVTYASVEGCRNINKEDHDALHDSTRQYTGNIIDRFMFLGLRKSIDYKYLRKFHCNAVMTDKAISGKRVKSLKKHERYFIQILHQQRFDHWILCFGERNEHAGFDICIYDSLKRDYQLTKNNRIFLERLCGTRDLNVFKSKSTDIQARGSNDSGPYVLAYASALLVGKNPGLCAIRDHRLVIRERIRETMIEMTSIPTLMIYMPPLYPRNDAGFCKYVNFVSCLCDFIGKTSQIRNQTVDVTMYDAMFSNDRVTRKYLYPSEMLPYASIIYHRATGTYFLISNIESGVSSKQAYIYEVDPDTIAVELMETLESPSSDSPHPIVASLIPSYQTKSTSRRVLPGGRKLRSVGKNTNLQLRSIDMEGIERHPQKWDGSQTGVEKFVNSLILCSIKLLELTNFIQPEEFDVTFPERKFENCIENLFTKFFTSYKASVIEDYKERIADEGLDEE